MNFKMLLYLSLIWNVAGSCNEQISQAEQTTQALPQTANFKAGTLGTTYYISTTGNDTNPGTEALPLLTITYAQLKVVPGDVVIVENGTYKISAGEQFGYLTKSGNSTSYITYKARNIGGAILDGQNNIGKYGFAVHASYVNVEGFEIKGMSGAGITVSGGASHGNFRDLNIHDIGRMCTDTSNGLPGFYLTASSYITIERCIIHDLGRYSAGENGCVTSTNHYKGFDHGIYCDGALNVTIQNNVFYNILHGFSLQVYSSAGGTSSNVSFINNTCENGNPYQYNGHIVLAGNLNYGLIANNIFKDHLEYAIRVYQNSYSYSNVLITKNIASGGNGILTEGTANGVVINNNFNNADPLFVNEKTHNFALTSSSPANVDGYPTAVTTDYLNNSRTNINIGAYAAAPLTVYYNIIKTAVATKNDCGTGYFGSSVTYTVPANKYNSTLSQTDADNNAQTDLDTNKQAYANANGTCTILYYNVQTSTTATKNDCGAGYTGSIVTYTILANKYSSTISQADADSKAQTDINANKQAYANSNGTCAVLYYSNRMSANVTKNDCGTGYLGSLVNYYLAYGYYNSTISQADADTKAIKRLSAYAQTYANANGTCTAITGIYYNSQISVNSIKNDCGKGYVGSSITYTVPANKYSSTVSQTDADNKALVDLNANKQTYANLNGTCTVLYYSNRMSANVTKNDCGTGYVGSLVNYYLAYGYYNSTISQADADNKAIKRLSTNAQTYANTNGTCIPVGQ